MKIENIKKNLIKMAERFNLDNVMKVIMNNAECKDKEERMACAVLNIEYIFYILTQLYALQEKEKDDSIDWKKMSKEMFKVLEKTYGYENTDDVIFMGIEVCDANKKKK